MYKALSPECIGHPITLQEAAPAAAQAGFEGMWLDLRVDCALGAQKTRTLLRQHGLRGSGFSLPFDFRHDTASYEAGLNAFREQVAFAEAVGLDRCITYIVPGSDERDFTENFQMHRERLRAISEMLQAHGVRFGLEFIGVPKALRNARYPFVHNLDGLLELISAINLDNVGLLMDVYHWELAGHSYEDFRKIPDASWVVLAHIMDAPAGVPPEEQEDLIRALPGSTGVLDIDSFFRSLQELGYDGPVLPEPFVAALSERPFAEAVRIAKEAVDRVWPV